MQDMAPGDIVRCSTRSPRGPAAADDIAGLFESLRVIASVDDKGRASVLYPCGGETVLLARDLQLVR